MRILSIGLMQPKSCTSGLRNDSLTKIAEIVDVVDTSKNSITLDYKIRNRLFQYGFPIHIRNINNEDKKILDLVSKNKYDIIWIDKGIFISTKTFIKMKELQKDAIVVSYTADNMALRHNQSQNFLEQIPLYDFHITTKSYILDDLKNLGAKRVIFTYQSYAEDFHYPRIVSDEDIKRLGADVGFVGMWEKERMESILFLTRNGIRVRVFGNSAWNVCKGDNDNLIIEDHGLFDDDYAKSFRCFKISLCFLRKINYDVHTTRTVEIPASGGFLLGERTDEHMQMFEEGKEAEFFGSNEELLEKCRYYLSHEKERLAIVEGGLNRCKKSEYSNYSTLKKVIKDILETKDER